MNASAEQLCRLDAPARTPTVCVVDDDAGVRDSLRWLAESAGLRVETHASAREFLAGLDCSDPGCLVLDLRMPGMSGLQLQEELALRRYQNPIIIITGHGGAPMARDAASRGAFAFIEKPFSDQQILDAIGRALVADQSRRAPRQGAKTMRAVQLTPRERAVAELLVAGNSDEAIAAALTLKPRVVAFYRARVCEKLGAQSVTEVARLLADSDTGIP